MTKDTKKAVAYLNKIIAYNNPQVAVYTLKNYGYPTQYDIIPAEEIEKALNDLYVSNYPRYINVIKSIPYRQDVTNWTTSVQAKDEIRNLARDLGMNDSTAKSGIEGAIDWIKGAITSTTTMVTGAGTVTQQSAVPAAVLLIVAVLAIGAVLWIWKSSPQ